jgi:hypothetical protein
VVFAGFLGTMNRYQVDIGGSVMQVYDTADAAFAVGEKVALDFPVADTVALDA